MVRNIGSILIVGIIFVTILFIYMGGVVWAKTDETLSIKGLKFTGVQNISINDIKNGIVTEDPSWKPWVPHPAFDEGELKKDIGRIETIYHNYGYYHAKAKYNLDKNLENNMVRVEIVVDEGKPTLTKEINIEINHHTHEPYKETLLKAIPLKKGEIFKVDAYEKSKEEIQKFLGNRGYQYAKVSGKAIVDKGDYYATAAFRVDTGPLQYFGPVSIKGNKDVASDIVLKELAFKEGDIFSLKKVYESQQNIYNLGLFKSVIIKPAGKEERETPIQIVVDEKEKRNLRVGLGYGDEEKFRAQAAWSRKNFLGNLGDLGLSLKYSSLIWSGAVDYTQPYFLDRNSNLGLRFGYDREVLESYTNEKISSQVKIGRVLDPNIEGFIGYDLELDRPVSVDETIVQELVETEEGKFYWISAPQIGLRRDTVKNVPDPQKGSVCSLFLESATFLLGSQADYLKAIMEAKVYRRVFPILTIATRFKLGFVEPFRETEEIPIFKRFFSGGSNSVRGYSFQGLGPVDREDNPIGGRTLMEGNLEFRHALFGELKGVAFLDAGTVSRDSLDFDLSDLRFSAGWGLRYNTIVGPIRLDLAFPLNPPPERHISVARFHFSIGHAF